MFCEFAWPVLVPLVAVGGLAILTLTAAARFVRDAWQSWRLPTSRIADAPCGLVELSGRTVPRDTVTAPLAAVPALGHETTILKNFGTDSDGHDDYRTVAVWSRIPQFVLDDGTGRALIVASSLPWPASSEARLLDPLPPDLAQRLPLDAPPGPFHVRESLLMPGELLYVVGQAEPNAGQPTPYRGDDFRLVVRAARLERGTPRAAILRNLGFGALLLSVALGLAAFAAWIWGALFF